MSNTISLNLHVGEMVRVRSERDILSTLDESGLVDGLPLMPEMLQYCGESFRVFKRADKTCDTIHYRGCRRMHRTVHLEGLRCDGSAHGGCQALCLLFWKEEWLERVDSAGSESCRASAARALETDLPVRCDRERLAEVAQVREESGGQENVRYRCQATDLLEASAPMRWWDLRQYARDVRCGNAGLAAVVRALAFRGFTKLLRLGGYRALIAAYNRLQAWRGGTPYPYTTGKLAKTPCETLDLRRGELVTVKSQEEILMTVDERRYNRGLSFDAEMVRFCGETFKVLDRVERIVDERTGMMIGLSTDCILLEGTYCRSEYSDKRLFCPRSIYPFWREIWLRRAEAEDVRRRAAPES